ncbi:MBL fold metallo-hydrolase, partial [Propionibacterium freudenreichii]|nr:MBL fold metallo-hydrolase [Propionibacterium freudenreichii]
TAARLGALADDAELWPGHGGRTYLSVERARNPMLRAGLGGVGQPA